MTVRGRVQDGRLHVDVPLDLPDGTEVELAVLVDDEDELEPEDRARLHEALHKSLAELARTRRPGGMCMCMCKNGPMAKTKRVQVLMEPEEFDVLEELARARGASVSDLMREAARVQLLAQVGLARRAEAVRQFLRLPEAPLPPWEQLKAEIEDRRG